MQGTIGEYKGVRTDMLPSGLPLFEMEILFYYVLYFNLHKTFKQINGGHDKKFQLTITSFDLIIYAVTLLTIYNNRQFSCLCLYTSSLINNKYIVNNTLRTN